MKTATHTFDTLQDLNDALPSLPVSAVITDRDGDAVPRSSLRHMVGTYAPYTVTPEPTAAPPHADDTQLATALLPLADAPDIENVPAAESMHTLMGAVAEIQHGVRQVLEAMSPEMVIERARASLPAWVEVMAEAEAMAAPSLPTQDGDDDGREAASLDPSTVKAGDTVTVHVAAAPPFDVHGKVWEPGMEAPAGLSVGNVSLTAPNVTLTDHQPAPEPEWQPGTTGTATLNNLVSGLGALGMRVMRVEWDGLHGFATQTGRIVEDGSTTYSVTDFVADTVATREHLAGALAHHYGDHDNLGDTSPSIQQDYLNDADAVLALLRGESL